MVLVTIAKFALVAGTIYITKELGVWDSPRNATNEKGEIKQIPNIPEANKRKDKSNILFDDDDKKDLQRKMDEYKKKYCHKGGICEPPPPKPWTESVADAWADTIKALKKLPGYWSQAFKDIGESICDFFSSTKDK
ncbi:uncharacterized protein [Drosophila tropicalis]|uniref:uncharacterized protein n=1 Tax=Drosophila tropicalis TaxID=46794 RepID=UPI0035AC19E3